MKDFELIKFTNGSIELDVNFSLAEQTIWLSKDQMATLFSRNRTVISRHVKDIFNENELEENSVSAFFAHTASDGKTYRVQFYNLDVILLVGYKVKSKNGIIFRRWANSVLKDYLLKGYAINEKRLEALNKTIEIQNKMIASVCNLDVLQVKEIISSYIDALITLDNYDHQCLPENDKKEDYIPLEYEELRKIINEMEYSGKSDVFGVEKEQGKLEGILAAVYQNVFGTEIYPSISSKAAHLLYFLIKDHPFADGCKRIAAVSFLTFLSKNKRLNPTLTSSTLVAVTLLVAESNPDDIESILKVITNII